MSTEAAETHRMTIATKIESLGHGIGFRFIERTAQNRLLPADSLEIIKFLCKDVWTELFGGYVGVLRAFPFDNPIHTLPSSRVTVNNQRPSSPCLSPRRPLPSRTLPAMRNSCRSGKPIDKLQTNHRGVFVLKDNDFKWLARYSRMGMMCESRASA